MKIRTQLLSTVLSGGIMLIGAMGLAGFAQAAEILQPDSNWAISKISASQQAGGGAYCALARRFNNNMVLTFARNNKDESSLALDFQKGGSLNRDTNYYVVLKPGAGQDRSFNVQPVSGRAMVVRLGKDYPFYDALSRAQQLDVKIAADNYSFSMADFATGQEELNACLANLTQPAAGDTADTTPATPASPAASAPAQTVEAPPVKTRPAAGPKMAAVPVGAVDETPVEKLAYAHNDAIGNKLISDNLVSDASSQVKPAHPVAPAPVAVDQTDQLQSLHEENVKLRTALADERRNYENQLLKQDKGSSFVAELNEKVSILQKENDSLRHQVSSTGPGAVAAAAGGASLAAMQADNAHLKSQLETLRGEVADAKSKIPPAQTAEQRAADDKKASEAERKLSEADQKLAAANQKMTEADQHLALADQKMASISKQTAQSSDADKKLADASLKLDAANKKLIEADQKIASADQQLSAANQKLTVQGTDTQKLSTADQQLDAANKKLAQLQGQLTQDDKAKADLAYERSVGTAAATAADQKLADATQKLDTANKKLAEADEKMAAANKTLQQASLQNTQKLSAATPTADTDRKLTEAAQKLAAATQRETEADQKLNLANAKAATAEQKLAEANQKILDAAQTRPAMASPVADKQQAAMVSSLQTQLQSLQTENLSLKDALKTAQATPAVAPAPVADNTSAAQLHAIEQQLTSVEQDRDRLKHQVDALSAGGNQHLINVATNDWNLEEATRRYNEAERQIRTLGVQLEQQRGDCEAEKKKIEYQLFDPAIATQAQIQKVSALEQEIDKTKADLAVERQRVSTLEAKSNVVTAVVANNNSNVGRISAQPIAYTEPVMSAPPPAMPTIATVPVVATPIVAAPPHAAAIKPIVVQTTIVKPAVVTKPAPHVAALAPLKDEQADNLAAISTAAGSPDGTVVKGDLAVGQISSRDIDVSSPSPVPAAPPAKIIVSSKPAPPIPQVSVTSTPAASVSLAKVAQATNALVDSPHLIDAQDLQAFLNKAIPVSNLTKVQNISRPDFVAYKWQSGSLFGSAEQQAMGGPSAFDTHVAEYLAKTKTHCMGSFAAKPGAAQNQDGVRIATYEIACVNDSASAAVSVLFFSQNGLFTTVAHEGSVDDMDVAMDARDKVLSKVLHTQIASNDLK